MGWIDGAGLEALAAAAGQEQLRQYLLELLRERVF